MKRVAIQGVVGSFHDIAAHQHFEGEQLQVICCSTFEQIFENIKRDPTVIGFLAIENTIAGSLLHNYELLRSSGTTIVGEHRLHIQHAICCLPDDDWSTIHEVQSHPVALMQCRNFLANHPELKAVEGEDTAGSAEYISRQQCHGWAAICHADAARMYGMKVLENHIEDNKHNWWCAIRIRPISYGLWPRPTNRAWSSRCLTRREACPRCLPSCPFTAST